MRYWLIALVLCALATLGSAAPRRKAAPRRQTFVPKEIAPLAIRTFSNPLKTEGADPCLFFTNGAYYLSSTTVSNVQLRRAERIGDLKNAPDVQVWKDDNPTRNQAIWAPEFHLLDAKDGSGPRWYLYYCATSTASPGHHIYVAQSAGTDPLGPYTFKAQLTLAPPGSPESHSEGIDGTVVQMPNGQLIFAWCGFPSPYGQGIYISKMSNPWTLQGARTSLDAFGFGSPTIREAPEFLVHNDKVFLVYSMCGASSPDYRLGALVANVGADLTDSKAWKQLPRLLMARVDQSGIWGPGHNFFFKSPDGTEDWIAYHAKTTANDTFADRTTRAQPIRWRPDGTPDFGLPVPTDVSLLVPSGEK